MIGEAMQERGSISEDTATEMNQIGTAAAGEPAAPTPMYEQLQSQEGELTGSDSGAEISHQQAAPPISKCVIPAQKALLSTPSAAAMEVTDDDENNVRRSGRIATKLR